MAGVSAVMRVGEGLGGGGGGWGNGERRPGDKGTYGCAVGWYGRLVVGDWGEDAGEECGEGSYTGGGMKEALAFGRKLPVVSPASSAACRSEA